MKKISIAFCFLFFVFCLKSQNLVPNGDFEFYTSCPTGDNQIYLAAPWVDPTGGTPDYYNACAPDSSLVSVPYQSNGAITVYQNTHSGFGYAALYTMQNNGGNYREYIQTSLSDTLIAGKCYFVTFYTNLFNLLRKGTNNVGAYISKTAITTSPFNVLNYTPQILLPGNPVIVDTVNWIKISGLYTAEGGEKYITIGNFQYDSSTVVNVFDTSSVYDVSYYYIDDVSLVACEDTSNSVTEYQDPFHIKLFPNPNDGNMTLSYTLPPTDKSALEIYDVTGRGIKGYRLNSNTDKLEIKDLHLKEGIYFYRVIVDGKRVNSNKLVIMNDR